MFSIPWKDNKKGMSVIEILIIVFIIAFVFTGLFVFTAFSLRTSITARETILAKNLAEEALEAVRNFRDGTIWDSGGLGNLIVGENNSYRLEKDFGSYPPKWNLIEGEEAVNGFIRRINFFNAQRDAADNIIESGGTADINTKKVRVIVSWQEGSETRQVEIITYLTNWQE